MLGANGAGKSTLLKALAGPRADAMPAQPIRLDGRDLTAPAAASHRRGGHRAGAGGPRHVRRADGAREPRCSAPSPRRARAQETRPPRPGARPVPAPAERLAPDRAHHERRRAADGGDRPRADVRARESCCSTSRRSASPPIVVQGAVRALARIRADGVGILLVEQNAEQSLAHRRPRLSARERPRRRRRRRLPRCAEDPAVQARLSRRAPCQTDEDPPCSTSICSSTTRRAKHRTAPRFEPRRSARPKRGQQGAPPPAPPMPAPPPTPPLPPSRPGPRSGPNARRALLLEGRRPARSAHADFIERMTARDRRDRRLGRLQRPPRRRHAARGRRR